MSIPSEAPKTKHKGLQRPIVAFVLGVAFTLFVTSAVNSANDSQMHGVLWLVSVLAYIFWGMFIVATVVKFFKALWRGLTKPGPEDPNIHLY
ncbi:hypothetical protein H0A71_19815 [Alcaligenaceae bacterium]|nr:hypothetical protein [Alcaligenaceae bacterium]